jgi:hypothetical protein
MGTDSGQTTSVWMAMAEVPQFPSLDEDTHADVCIIGAASPG